MTDKNVDKKLAFMMLLCDRSSVLRARIDPKIISHHICKKCYMKSFFQSRILINFYQTFALQIFHEKDEDNLNNCCVYSTSSLLHELTILWRFEEIIYFYNSRRQYVFKNLNTNFCQQALRFTDRRILIKALISGNWAENLVKRTFSFVLHRS